MSAFALVDPAKMGSNGTGRRHGYRTGQRTSTHAGPHSTQHQDARHTRTSCLPKRSVRRGKGIATTDLQPSLLVPGMMNLRAMGASRQAVSFPLNF
ncbi:hypothetical protein KC356_g283 [Hortaea werneckii]|nr:hypothetical protein KC356_g283 [Hortaea werneckii]